jgi:uncharacterized glyoxalase superfamily protein PhnB
MDIKVRMEGVTLTVADVKRSSEYDRDQLGFTLEVDAAPLLAMLRIGGAGGGTVGLHHWKEAKKEVAHEMSAMQSKAVHIELSTDGLDGLYQQLLQRGVKIDVPPHDQPWERSMTVFDPDGYLIEFAQGRRGKKAGDAI